MNREMMKARPIISVLCQLVVSLTIAAIFIPFTASTASGGDWDSGVARELQKQIDEINNKWPLNDNEIAMLNELEIRRNALWKKAVKASGPYGNG